MIFLLCPSCSETFAAFDQDAEKQTMCPFCDESVQVPKKSESRKVEKAYICFRCPRCHKPAKAKYVKAKSKYVKVSCPECEYRISLADALPDSPQRKGLGKEPSLIFLSCPSCSRIFAGFNEDAEKETICPFCSSTARVPSKNDSLNHRAQLCS